MSANDNNNPTAYLSKIAKGAAINFSGAIGRTIIVYTYTILLARMLPVNELGYYWMLFTIITIASLISTLGLELGVVRYISLFLGEGKPGQARSTLNAALWLGIPVSIIVAGALFFLAPVLSEQLFDGNPVATSGTRIFVLAVPLWVMSLLFCASTQGFHIMKYQVYSKDFGEQLSRLIISAAVLAMGAGLIGVVWANVTGFFVSAVMSGLFALLVFKRAGANKGIITESPARRLYKYSYPLALSNVIRTVHRWIDMLLLGYIATSVDVGYYGSAIRVGTFSIAILMAFNMVFSPVISDLHNRNKTEELHSLLKVITRWVFVINYPIFLVLVIFARPVMGLFGEDFKIASTALIILAIGQFFNSLTGPVGQMVLMSGHSRVVFVNTSVSLLTNIGLCIALIPAYGIIGAAVANLTSLCLVNVMRAAEVWIFLRMNAYDFSFLKPFAAGTFAALVVLFAKYTIADESLVLVALFAVILVILYTVAISLLGLNDDDRKVLRLFRAKFLRAEAGN